MNFFDLTTHKSHLLAGIASAALCSYVWILPMAAYAQTIDIGPNEYTFRFTNNPNYGLYNNDTGSRFEFRNGSAATVLGIDANNGQLSTSLQFNSESDYLVPDNRYAFRAKVNPNFGLYYNGTGQRYEFRGGSSQTIMNINAASGDMELTGGIRLGNSGINEAGSIRYLDGNFEGYDGSSWRSLANGLSGLQAAFDNENTIVTTSGKPLTINGPGGLSASGKLNSPTIAAQGAGTRMMWSGTGAFRAGRVGVGLGSSTAWNQNNLGSQSFAIGTNTLASSAFTVAMGENTTASGGASLAAGNSTIASGLFSLALGENTRARSRNETAIGINNTDYTPQSADQSDPQDRILVVGNGSSTLNRSDALVILKNGNVGIGDSNPSSRLNVRGGNWDLQNTDGDVMISGNGAKLKISMSTDGAGKGVARINSMGGFSGQALHLGVNGNTHLAINSQGFIGIGTTTPTTAVEIPLGTNRSLQFTNAGFDPAVQPNTDAFGLLGTSSNKFWQAYVHTYFGLNTSILSISDASLKENVVPMKDGLEKLMQLKPVSYDFIPEKLVNNQEGRDRLTDQDIKDQMGFIAQEVQEVFPQLVRPLGEGSEILTLGYSGLIPVIVQSIQEQQLLIKEKENEKGLCADVLETAIAERDKEIASLNAMADELMTKMGHAEQDLGSCCAEVSKQNGSAQITEFPELGQNIPNPFRESTVIQYYLPENTASAIIRVLSLEGKPVKDLVLGATHGHNQVEFHTSGLPAGTYLYSLFVDGELINTKRMMIAR